MHIVDYRTYETAVCDFKVVSKIKFWLIAMTPKINKYLKLCPKLGFYISIGIDWATKYLQRIR